MREAGHAATRRRSNQVRAVVVRTPGRERIEDLIERTMLIQAAKGVLRQWRLVQAAPRDPRRRNRQSASMRVDQKALVGAGRLERVVASSGEGFEPFGVLAGDGAQSVGEAGFQSINAGRGLTLRRGGADGFATTAEVGVDWFWVAMTI